LIWVKVVAAGSRGGPVPARALVRRRLGHGAELNAALHAMRMTG